MSDGSPGGGGTGAPRGSRPGPRSRRLQRMLDEGPRTSGKTWVQLLLFVLVLVFLFASRDEIGRRAAGCYGVVEGHDAAPAATPAPAEAGHDAPAGAEVPASVRIERRPAGPAVPDDGMRDPGAP